MAQKSIITILNTRPVRLLFGLIALFVFSVTFIPYIFSYENTDGIINARTITLTSPIEGKFSFEIDKPVIGTPVSENQLIATVTNTRLDRSYYYGLLTDRESLTQKVISFKNRVEILSALDLDLYNRTRLYQKYTIQKLEAERASYIKDLDSVNAEVSFYETELKRHHELYKSKSIPKTKLDETKATYDKLQAKVESLQFLSDLASVKIAAAQDNTFLGDGHNDVPYSQQRYDEIKIITSELIATIEENDKRISDIDFQLKEEQRRLDLAAKFDVISPFNGIIWRLPILENSTVVINSELIQLMNCDELYLDITATERNYDNVYPGMEIKYRLHGDSQFFIGHVESVRGSGILNKDRNVAATIDPDGKREFSVTIRISKDDIKPTAKNYCQVGRRVIVKFPQSWALIDKFVSLFK